MWSHRQVLMSVIKLLHKDFIYAGIEVEQESFFFYL